MSSNRRRRNSLLKMDSVAHASDVLRGKRSGVVINTNKLNDRVEDIDAMFEAVRSPVTRSSKRRVRNKAKKAKSKAKKRPAPERKLKRTRNSRVKTVRMSLPGVADEPTDGDEEIKASKYLSKIMSSKGGPVIWSPSDLSNVSSAPSTPATQHTSETDKSEQQNVQPTPRKDPVIEENIEEDEPEVPEDDIIAHQEDGACSPQALETIDVENNPSAIDNQTPTRTQSTPAEGTNKLEISELTLDISHSQKEKFSPLDQNANEEVAFEQHEHRNAKQRETREHVVPIEETPLAKEQEEQSTKGKENEAGTNQDIQEEGSPAMSPAEQTMPLEQSSTENNRSLRSPAALDVEVGQDNDNQEDDDDLIPPHPPEELMLDENVQESPTQDAESGSAGEASSSPALALEDDDDEDKEGPGFEMASQDEVERQHQDTDEDDGNNNDDLDGAQSNVVHDPETPESVRARRIAREKREKKKKKRQSASAKRFKKARDEPREDVTPVRVRKSKRKRPVIAVSPHEGYPIANRGYEVLPVGAFVRESPEDPNLRRSRRARCKPLAFWKNERLVYGPHDEPGELGEAMGDMPIVTEVLKALPTPHMKRNVSTEKRKLKVNFKSDKAKTFDSRKLRKKYKVVDGETAHIWDEGADDSADLKVVAYAKNMEAFELPVPKSRKKNEGRVVGRAAQAFNIAGDDQNGNYVGYIMGNLVLPPKGIKDAESVGPCSQTFTVCNCQPKALEVSFGDPDQPEGTLDPETAQRFLLGPGDLFRVPPGNCYKLENHSSDTDCFLTWTIIRPRVIASASGSSGSVDC